MATSVVQSNFQPMLALVGAPGSVPATISRPSCWLRIPHGRTANSTTHQIKKKMASAVATGISGLFEFDQRAGKILRMQEQHRLAMGADFRFAIAQHPCPGRFERIARGANVADLVADMMNAAIRIAVEK